MLLKEKAGKRLEFYQNDIKLNTIFGNYNIFTFFYSLGISLNARLYKPFFAILISFRKERFILI